MLTRVAVFEGAVTSGGEDAFFADVQARLEPVWRSFPHVQAVRVLRTTEADPGAIPVVMVLEMDFATMDAGRHRLVRAAVLPLRHRKPHAGRRAVMPGWGSRRCRA